MRNLSAGLEAEVGAVGPWFYDFDLGGGVRTGRALPEDLRSIHADRLSMLRAGVRRAFPRGLAGLHALDVGCHEGYFAHELIRLGAGSVTGVDVRAHNLRKARLAAEATGMTSLSWILGDAEDLGSLVSGRRFELALAFGLIYHCENPVRVLRQLAAVTRDVIILETQLLDEPGCGPVEWGRQGYQLPVRGAFGVVDESRLHPANHETGSSPLALCPSQEAVRTVLAHCGFGRVERVAPPPGANEQLARGKRGVFIAWRDGAGA